MFLPSICRHVPEVFERPTGVCAIYTYAQFMDAGIVDDEGKTGDLLDRFEENFFTTYIYNGKLFTMNLKLKK
jgi:hypothetical protein